MEPTTTTPQPLDAAPPPPKAIEEDSGLHDIRSLAQSTKQRLSRKITAAPPIDDDVLASSSAGWKAVALPEPAKMISLPALDQLPSKKQIKEQLKADKAEKKLDKADAGLRAPTHLEESTPVAKVAAPAASMSFGANIVAKQSGSKTPLYIVLGLGLAAAAGGAIYVATQGKHDAAPAPAVATAETAPKAAPIVTPLPTPPPAPVAAAGTADVVAPPVDVPVAAPPVVEISKAPAKHTSASKAGAAKPEAKKVEATVVAKPELGKKSDKGAGKEAAKDGEPDFNDLLKEAGVKDPAKAKPKLDKKSLSGGDFKAGMASIAGKAQACYAGTQGTAAVKLTIAPDGKVAKASVSGPFAGTAVAACVEAAVRGASFPAWDGGPQSFGYSFLLSE